MKMRKTLFALTVLTLTLIPGMAAAQDSVPAMCDAPAFLLTDAGPAATPAAAPFDSPIAAQDAQATCCVAKRAACAAACACGVFEFNCNPGSCQSSCICNICP